MHVVWRTKCLSRVVRCRTEVLQKCCSSINSETQQEDAIQIPNRIPRTPTSILHALANTVKRDPTAAHYKYHDDPYLIPSSNVGKRTFAMSQEAGRKAAKWIQEKHRNLFLHQEADPPIEAFAPKMVFTEDTEVDEQTLCRLIRHSNVSDAVFVYNLLKNKGVSISDTTKQSLLELVCFYNNEEPLPEEYIEERWFQQSVAPRDRYRKTWKDGDLAEKLFAEIEPKNAQSYAAIIRGMCKFFQAERAYALLQEATEKQLHLDTTTFNSVIQIVNLLKDTADQRWDVCRELLQQMAQQGLKPNLSTMNALLECISSFGNFKFARSCTLKVLAEFKALGIEPSLGTYYYVLINFCRERSPVSHVIVDILREIEGKHFTIMHPKDTYFFASAMDICRHHLHDKSIAKKLDVLLHTGNNYDLIGDSYKESVYYRNFLALLCQTETFEEFMQTYDLLVPNIYIPEPGIMEEVLKALEVNVAIEYLPRLWSDMIIFDHINRESLLSRTLKIMIENKPVETESDSVRQALGSQFAKIAQDIYNKVQESDSNEARFKKLTFTGQMIGDILTILVRGGEFEKALEVFNHIDKNQHRIPGTPTEECLMEFVECCIVNKAPSVAVAVLQYAVDNSMDGLTLAKRINEGFTLNETHVFKIKSLIGDSFMN